MGSQRWIVGALAETAILLVGIAVCNQPAIAVSDHNTDTYSGDYPLGSLPDGTFIGAQYFGYGHADAFIDSTGHVLPNSHANIWEEFTRFAYIGNLWGHAFAIDVAVPFATVTDLNIPGTNNLVAGGLEDPVVDFTYYAADGKTMFNNQRWLGITNYFYLPFGRAFDNQKAVNVSTPSQFTDIIQIGYTEGLRNLSPSLNGVFFDLVANAAFHTNGSGPLTTFNPAGAAVPGVLSYDTTTQSNTYSIRAFLRYQPDLIKAPLQFFSVGIEKSWGGEQSAANGRFTVAGSTIVIPQANLVLGNDDFLRGHFQFEIPLAMDFGLAADVFHDFRTVGGFRENIGVEFRFLKWFAPPSPKG